MINSYIDSVIEIEEPFICLWFQAKIFRVWFFGLHMYINFLQRIFDTFNIE